MYPIRFILTIQIIHLSDNKRSMYQKSEKLIEDWVLIVVV